MADQPDSPDRSKRSDSSAIGDDEVLAELRAIGRHRQSETAEWEDPPGGLWDRIADHAGAAPISDSAPTVLLTRRRPWVPVAAVAAALLVAILVGSLLVITNRGGPDVVAVATLDQLGTQGSGSVELVDDGGRLRLRVDTADLDPGDGFLELWVIDPDVSQLVSLGPLRSDGIHELPAGLDPADFPIVDISVEPLDGDPTHSGDSVLRGQLDL